ncbi:MAG: hypothetical protein E6J75_00970 [Deltaproteobacteria bacterium]|nr:MAG: hypothetical protein E6J75_00970 [Deltaproteobacteria bacterium]
MRRERRGKRRENRLRPPGRELRERAGELAAVRERDPLDRSEPHRAEGAHRACDAELPLADVDAQDSHG